MSSNLREVTKINRDGLWFVEYVRRAGAAVEFVSWTQDKRAALLVESPIAFAIRKRNPGQVRVSGIITSTEAR